MLTVYSTERIRGAPAKVLDSVTAPTPTCPPISLTTGISSHTETVSTESGICSSFDSLAEIASCSCQWSKNISLSWTVTTTSGIQSVKIFRPRLRTQLWTILDAIPIQDISKPIVYLPFLCSQLILSGKIWMYTIKRSNLQIYTIKRISFRYISSKDVKLQVSTIPLL